METRLERADLLPVRAYEFSSSCGRALRLLLSAVSLTLALGCQGGGSFFVQLDDSRRLAADIRIQFTRAADASNRAVMANTDEASAAFAADAEESVKGVESDVAALSSILDRLRFLDEVRVLREFNAKFAEYRAIDRSVLGLAVENTNLKAQRLAFGPAREAADDLRDALDAIATSVTPKDRCAAGGLIAQATLAVREIQGLHAPHIAESEAAVMNDMERQMARLEASARSAVTSLASLVPPGARPTLASAVAALDRFAESSRQIVALSRRNSNVRSLDLSLREKPPLSAACDESLRMLQNLLAKRDIKSTR